MKWVLVDLGRGSLAWRLAGPATRKKIYVYPSPKRKLTVDGREFPMISKDKVCETCEM